MKVALSFLLLYFTCAFSAHVTHYALLSAEQVLQRVPSDDMGFGVFTLNEDTNELQWAIFHNAMGVQAAHIHGPALPGVGAGVRVPLTASRTIVGSAMLSAMDAEDLKMGRMYVNIHTVNFTDGGIRGQIVNKWQTVCHLKGMNEVPPNNSTHRGWALITVDPMSMKLTYNVTHTVTEVTGAHIHGAADEGMTAGLLFGLTSTSSTMYAGSATLTAAWMKHFWDGKLYINIHSKKFPGGDIRCQIMPPVGYAAWLKGTFEVPPNPSKNVGAAIAWKKMGMDGTHWLKTMIWHNISTGVTGAHIHGPAPAGSTTGFIINVGTMMMTDMTYSLMNTMMANHSDWLMNHHLYVNVHTTTYPSGDIRGQLMELAPMTARPCPKGYHIPESGMCTICPAGSMSSMEDSTMCTMCKAGTFSYVGSSRCMYCDPGFYSSMDGASACMMCPMGTMSTGGKSMCTMCMAGYYAAMEGMSYCMPCEPGTMQNKTGASSCMDCKAGTRSLGAATSCTPCPSGYYSDMMADNCMPCPAGWRSDLATTGSTKCMICGVGRFTAKAGMGTCTLCPKGYYMDMTGGMYCMPCPPGKYQDLTGASTCKMCPAGMTSMGGSAACMAM